jgi:pimeloyl-ACP methyl ester carboxylesterase
VRDPVVQPRARQLDGTRKAGHIERMLRILLTVVGAVLLGVCLLIAFGGVRALAYSRPPLRGEMVDIGGRKMRIVCEGPKSDRPLVVMESGIFGFAADWGVVQARLAAIGIRSCAYDRAGLGYSDPGPEPRDGIAIVSDLEALLKAHGDDGPLILVGHSMAGLHTRLFAIRNPGRVKGMVLIDAMLPSVASSPEGRARLEQFAKFGHSVWQMSHLGVLKAISPWQGDSIGLEGEARREKIWFFGSSSFNRVGEAETKQSLRAAEQTMAAGRLDPEIPVAVVTEGPKDRAGSAWGRGRTQAAQESKHGSVENVEGATHADLLGRKHADVIVRAVQTVMKAGGFDPGPPAPARDVIKGAGR